MRWFNWWCLSRDIEELRKLAELAEAVAGLAWTPPPVPALARWQRDEATAGRR
jgi:hypothetical protein